MNARIDAAAERAGRRPADVRRLLDVNGRFGGGSGFLDEATPTAGTPATSRRRGGT